MNAILLVLPILTLLMFQLGLELSLKDFQLILKRPKAIIVGLVGQLFLPVLAFILAYLFQLEAVFFIGLVLIACSPSGSSSNVFTMLAKGDVALAVSLTAFSSILTLFVTPFVVALAMSLVDGFSVGIIELPVGSLIIQNLLLMLLPILIGMLAKYKFPAKSDRIRQLIGKITFPTLLILISIFFIQHYEIIFQYIGKLGLVVLILILSALVIGYLIAWATKLHEKEKRTIIIEIGMQNAAQAIAIASSPFIFNNEMIAIPAIIYALLMNIVLLTYVKIKARKRE